jgi:hypothetical protein
VPFVVLYLQTADVTNGMLATGCPERQLSGDCQTTNDVRVNGFLKNDQVRAYIANYFRQFPFAFSSSEANVIAEELTITELFAPLLRCSKAHQTTRRVSKG